MIKNTYPWPLPDVSPDDFFSLDPGLQKDASRMTASYIKAVLDVAQQDVEKVICQAKTTSKQALKKVRGLNL